MDNSQKTIFVSINRGSASRSFLRSGFLGTLLNDESVHVVLVLYLKDPHTPVADYFKEEFSHPRISIESIEGPRYSKWRRVFMDLTDHLIYSRAEYRHIKYGGIGKRKASPFLLFLFQHVFYSTISKLRILRHFARFLERHVFDDRGTYTELFDRYNPDLLFCASVYGTIDAALMKEAYHRGIRTVSTPKSWDTVTRQFFRFPSDKLIVANEWMKGIIADEQLINPHDISVAGLIQFDVYGQKREHRTKESLLSEFGLDPAKPVILFAPEGRLTGDNELYVRDLVEHGFLERYNMILRPHFSDLTEQRYEEFRGVPGIYIDDHHMRMTNMFGDLWDPLWENLEWQEDVIRICDVVICFMSTMVLDANILDKPVVTIKYEPPETTRRVPIGLLYTFRHIEALLEEHSLLVAESREQLLAHIETYLKNPALQKDERARAVARFAGVIDGKAGERTAQAVLRELPRD